MTSKRTPKKAAPVQSRPGRFSSVRNGRHIVAVTVEFSDGTIGHVKDLAALRRIVEHEEDIEAASVVAPHAMSSMLEAIRAYRTLQTAEAQLREAEQRHGSAKGGAVTKKAHARPGLDDLIKASVARGDTKDYVRQWADAHGVTPQTIYNQINRVKNDMGRP